MPRHGAELELRRLAQRHTRPALATIVSIMRNRDNPPAVRLNAADMVLNRGHGKPIQPHANPDLSPLDWNSMPTEELLSALQRLEVALGERDPVVPAGVLMQGAQDGRIDRN